MWIPINKTTGYEYPAVNDDGKKSYENDPVLSKKYRFKMVPGSDRQAAPAPVEAKKVVEKAEDKQ